MIKIAMRLKPFSHLPGIMCLIPKSSWRVQVFPTKLRFHNFVTNESYEEVLPWAGPVKDFTVTQDLEKGCIQIFGKTKSGYKSHIISKPEGEFAAPERLSLGSHKALNWSPKLSLLDILPVWYHLSQLTQSHGKSLFPKDLDKLEVGDYLRDVLMAYFEGILSPRLIDTDYQGIATPCPSTHPLGIITHGGAFIRSLFFQETDSGISLLPCLPPEMHAGRFTSLKTSHGDLIDLEWSKKLLKKVVIHPAHTREVRLHLQHALKSFRINRRRRVQAKDALLLTSGQMLILDRFEK
jgi:hypothetical protein